MKSFDKLAQMRKAGMKPAAVMLTLYPAKQPQWWREDTAVEIVMGAAGRVDLRSLVGCHVVIVADERGDNLRKLTEQVQQYAESIAVLSSEHPDDIGHAWERGKGWRRFGDGPVMEVA